MVSAAQRRPSIALILLVFAYIAWGYANKLVPVSSQPLTFWVLAAGPDVLFVSALSFAHLTGQVKGELYYLEAVRRPQQFLLDCLFCYAVFAVIVLFLHHPLSFIVDIGRYLANAGELGSATELRAYQTIQTPWNVPLMALALIAGSISEEVVYRGMLRRLVEKRSVYVIGSSLLFAGTHMNQGINAVLVALVMGVAACALLIQLRSLAPLIAGHVAVNLTVLAQH